MFLRFTGSGIKACLSHVFRVVNIKCNEDIALILFGFTSQMNLCYLY